MADAVALLMLARCAGIRSYDRASPVRLGVANNCLIISPSAARLSREFNTAALDGRGGATRELRELLAMTAPPAGAGEDLGSTIRLSPVRATLRQRSALGSAKVLGPEQQQR